MAYIQDGFRTVFRIPGVPGVQLRTRELQPPALLGGAPIETYTMHNGRLETYEPQGLVATSDIVAQCNYDPLCYNLLLTAVLNEKWIYVITFPDGATMTFLAFMYEFTPASLRKGEFPLAEVKFRRGNRSITGAEDIVGNMVAAGATGNGSLAWPPSPRPFPVGVAIG